jgi:hypothetical protein
LYLAQPHLLICFFLYFFAGVLMVMSNEDDGDVKLSAIETALDHMLPQSSDGSALGGK